MLAGEVLLTLVSSSFQISVTPRKTEVFNIKLWSAAIAAGLFVVLFILKNSEHKHEGKFKKIKSKSKALIA